MPCLDQQMTDRPTDRPTEQHTSHRVASHRVASHHIRSHRSPALDETAVGEKVSVAEGTPEDTDISTDISTAVVSVHQAYEIS